MQQINLNWKFKKLPQHNIQEMKSVDGICLDDAISVELPHTWYQDGNGYQGTVIYQKTLELTYTNHQRVFLNFQAADRFCKVFVNQQYVGEHKGGYSAFSFDITQNCKSGQQNVISVLLDNRSFDHISPLAGDFTIFGGLYRDVFIIMTDQTCFDRSYYGTSGVIVRADVVENQGRIFVENHLLGGEGTQISYQIWSPNGQMVLEHTIEAQASTQLFLNNPVLWDGLNNPAMYTLQAVLLAQGRQVDEVKMPFGFKKIALDAEKGFFLNGRHVKIQGVAKHQDYAEVFCATGSSHWEQDMHNILEVGANSVRLSHYQHPQEMYDLCDKNGLIVWAEIPMLKFLDEERLFDNACNQLKELILQNVQHPSICFWGIQNEIAMFGESTAMYEKMQALAELVKELDPTRLSACANLFCVKNESPLNTHTQAVGYNIYFGWYYGNMEDNADFVEQFHRDNPHIPLGITEYGVDCNVSYHTTIPKVRDYSEEFQALYHETVYPIFAQRDYIWGTYIWNLCDFSSEIRDEGGVKYKNCKGIMTYDRKIKKDAFYYYKAQWFKKPFVKIAESRFVNRDQWQTTVKVYSNCEQVELTVAGRTYQQTSKNGIFIFEEIQLIQGENVVVARAGKCVDQATFQGVLQPDEHYIYVDQNPGINVKNWFIDAVEEEKVFPTGRFSIRDACNTIVENEQAIEAVAQFSPKLAEQMKERRGMMPLERILNYMKKDFSEEDCKRLNTSLTKIKKS